VDVVDTSDKVRHTACEAASLTTCRGFGRNMSLIWPDPPLCAGIVKAPCCGPGRSGCCDLLCGAAYPVTGLAFASPVSP